MNLVFPVSSLAAAAAAAHNGRRSDLALKPASSNSELLKSEAEKTGSAHTGNFNDFHHRLRFANPTYLHIQRILKLGSFFFFFKCLKKKDRNILLADNL